MPPKGWRKTEISKSSLSDGENISIEDIAFPRTTIVRIAKSVLPDNTQIQKDAVTALYRSATLFVSYLGAHASDTAKEGGRKVITHADVINALKYVELDDLIPPVSNSIDKFLNSKAVKAARRKKSKEFSLSGSNDDLSNQNNNIENVSKKPKTDPLNTNNVSPTSVSDFNASNSNSLDLDTKKKKPEINSQQNETDIYQHEEIDIDDDAQHDDIDIDINEETQQDQENEHDEEEEDENEDEDEDEDEDDGEDEEDDDDDDNKDHENENPDKDDTNDDTLDSENEDKNYSSEDDESVEDHDSDLEQNPNSDQDHENVK